MHSIIHSMDFKGSWYSCPWWVNVRNKKHTHHASSTKIECDYLYGWIKKMVTYAKISPILVKPTDTAGNTKKRRRRVPNLFTELKDFDKFGSYGSKGCCALSSAEHQCDGRPAHNVVHPPCASRHWQGLVVCQKPSTNMVSECCKA